MRFYLIFFAFGLILLSQMAISKPTETFILNDADKRYDVNSAAQGSGFYVCPEGSNLFDIANSETLRPLASEGVTRPNFKKNKKYCFHMHIVNTTEDTNWALHFSHFFIDKINVLVRGTVSSTVYTSDLSGSMQDSDFNVLGRSFFLDLKRDESYFLVFELTASRVGRPPYIGLMSEYVYKDWSSILDAFYKVAVGVILGLVTVALLCSLVLKDITFFWFGASSLCLFFLSLLRSHVGVGFMQNAHDLPSSLWLLVTFTNVSILMFARSFISVDDKASHLIRVFDVAVICCCVFFFFSFFLSDFLNSILYSVSGAVSIVIISYSACVKLVQKGRYYLIFMLGWMPVLISIAESIYIIFVVPDEGENTLSYKNITELYIQVAHMLIHMVAMLIRILDLKKLRYQAEFESESKSKFLASVSHDLRQPLHSMGLFLTHLSAHIETDAGKKIFSKIYNMHGSIDDSFKALMDLSRLEAGAVKVNQENIDISALVNKLCLEFEPYAQSKNLSFRVRPIQKIVCSDPLLLKRIIRNLLSNALKYTYSGGVLLGFRVRKNQLHLQVWDTGSGISLTEQEVIFDIYNRSKQVNDNHFGAGIGLAVVKHLSDILDHKISVSSKEQRGSMFQIVLPIINGVGYGASKSQKEIKSDIDIYLDISDLVLYDEITKTLSSWGYASAKLGNNDNGNIERTSILIVASTDPIAGASTENNASEQKVLKRISTYQSNHGDVAVAFFIDDVSPALAEKLQGFNVHLLNTRFRPSQLRSLIRYLEISNLKNKH